LGACLADLSAHATSSFAERTHRPPKTDPTGNSSCVPPALLMVLSGVKRTR
jgi:hypothetical protein